MIEKSDKNENVTYSTDICGRSQRNSKSSKNKKTKVGAGSVVTKDVQTYSVVVGNPAKFKKKRLLIMRIALIVGVPVGGAFAFFSNIAQILSKKHDVHIYHRLKSPRRFGLGYIIPSIYAALRCNIIISHSVHWPGCISTICAKIFWKKSVIIIVGNYFDEIPIRYKHKGILGMLMIKLLSILEFISLHLADIIVSADYKVTEHLERKGIKKIVFWKGFGAIDLQQFRYSNTIRKEYRKKLAIPNSDPVLLFVGWLVQWEGADTALNVYRTLSKQTKNLWLIFIGSGVLEESIKETIAEENLNKVILTGFVPHGEIHNYMMMGDIGVMPLREPQCGIGSIPLELMALGIPIIATDVGMLREVIIDEETGFVVKNNITEKMVQKADFLVKHPELLNKMKTNARKEIEKNFSLEITSSKVFSLIDTCICPKSA